MKKCLFICHLKPRPSGQYYMYIATLRETNNHGIGFLFPPFVKRFRSVGSCIETLWKPKCSSEGLTHPLGYLAQSTSLPESDAERQLESAARGDCPVGSDSGVALSSCQVRILR